MEWKELNGNFRKRIRKRELLRILPETVMLAICEVLGTIIGLKMVLESETSGKRNFIFAVMIFLLLYASIMIYVRFRLFFKLRHDGSVTYLTGTCIDLNREFLWLGWIRFENNQIYRHWRCMVSVEYDGLDSKAMILTNLTRHRECGIGEGVYIISYSFQEKECLECYASVEV